MKKKSVITAIFVVLSGVLTGGIVMTLVVTYFLGGYYANESAMDRNHNLKINIGVLESLKNDDKDKAIMLLESEAAINLVQLWSMQGKATDATNKVTSETLARAKAYFEKYPAESCGADLKSTIDEIVGKIETNPR